MSHTSSSTEVEDLRIRTMPHTSSSTDNFAINIVVRARTVKNDDTERKENPV